LARALLLKTKIIVLDEATANVDLTTDNFIQAKLRESFIEQRNATVIVIAHRLATVIDSDRILVMANGQGLEYDHPFNLLTRSNSDTEVTRTESHFAQMVKASGDEAANQFFLTAKDSFYRNKK